MSSIPNMSWLLKDDGKETRLNHLLQTGAFNDQAELYRGKSQRAYIKNGPLKLWFKDNASAITHLSPSTWRQLKNDTKGFKLDSHEVFRDGPFETITPGPEPHLLVDKRGKILAYKFRIPQHLLDTLKESATAEKLPPTNLDAHQRGDYERKHYALWCDSAKEPLLSSEYRKELPYSETFLETNRKLFNLLDNKLRCLNPEMYNLFTSVDRYMPKDLKRLGGAWHGTVINRQIGSNSELHMHKDWLDWKGGFNAVVPWGDYTGGDLTFYNAGVRWQLEEGDAIFFMGSIISHGVGDLTSGVRNSLDLMVHRSTILWRDRKMREAGIPIHPRAPITKAEEKKREAMQKKEKKRKAKEMEEEQEEEVEVVEDDSTEEEESSEEEEAGE